MNNQSAHLDSKLKFSQPYNNQLSPLSGWTREHIEESFFILMKGIVDSASKDGARQRILGPRSHHGLLADEMEGFSRSFIMGGPWLASSDSSSFTHGGRTVDVAEFYKCGILAGTDPNHPEYWGDIVDFAQHLVECASLAWSLYLSKEKIWDTFTDAEKKQVADYLFQCTKVKYHQNNWLLFNVITNAVLKKLGMPYSQEQIDANIKACDHMYLGAGWYRDGKINRIDYYSAWAFHYYYLIWTILDGDSKPDIAQMHKARANEFVNTFQYFFSADGSAPCFGRSMIYRFGYLAPVALGQHLGILDIAPGKIRSMMNLGMKFYFDNPILTEAGHLSVGFLRANEKMLEHYSCGGSPYWATKAYNALLIGKNDPFWGVEEEPLPIHETDYVKTIKDIGISLVGTKKSGHVQLINHKAYHDKADYNDKYTNFAYSSIFSYEAGTVYKSFNCDNALQFSDDGINWRQRWNMENLYAEKGFLGSTYSLHGVDDEGRGYSSTVIKDDFLVNFHKIQTSKELQYKEGGYPLGWDEGVCKTESSDTAEMASVQGKISYVRNVQGYTRKQKALPYFDQMCGTNIRYIKSVVPVLFYEGDTKQDVYLASMVYGKVGQESVEELDSLIKETTVHNNTLVVRFYDDECVFVQIGDIEPVTVELNGNQLSGNIVFARIDASGNELHLIKEEERVLA